MLIVTNYSVQARHHWAGSSIHGFMSTKPSSILTPEQIDWVIRAAWHDYTSFEAIEARRITRIRCHPPYAPTSSQRAFATGESGSTGVWRNIANDPRPTWSIVAAKPITSRWQNLSTDLRAEMPFASSGRPFSVANGLGPPLRQRRAFSPKDVFPFSCDVNYRGAIMYRIDVFKTLRRMY